MPTKTSKRWWSNRPWADALTVMQTSPLEPGQRLSVPLQPSRRRRRTRPEGTLMPMHARGAPTDRRGHDAFGLLYRALQLPASARLVEAAEAERLEQARRAIEFRPKHGFLHSTPVVRHARRAYAASDSPDGVH